jgi:hypothetical protein
MRAKKFPVQRLYHRVTRTFLRAPVPLLHNETGAVLIDSPWRPLLRFVAPGSSRSGQPLGPYAKLQRPPAQCCPFGFTGSITGFSCCYLYLGIIPLVGFG